MRALLSELGRSSKCWPTVLSVVQSVLNNGKLRKLGNVSLLTSLTSQKGDSSLLHIERGSGLDIEFISIDEIRAKQLIEVEKVSSALDDMHKKAHSISSQARRKRIKLHNSRTNVHQVNFEEGDFVMKSN